MPHVRGFWYNLFRFIPSTKDTYLFHRSFMDVLLSQDFIRCVDFTRITALNPATDDVAN